ncbi:MAG: hypothetical protein IKD70_06810 [Eggerthellaceae bacterium]|nr:hypothetical protein [Eggerthellaceae bacterium]
MPQQTDLYRRTPLEAGSAISFDRFTCENMTLISTAGGSGLVYEATSRDYYGTEKAAPARLVVKECYPADIAPYLVRDGEAISFAEGAPASAREAYAMYLNRFADAFFVHTALYQSALQAQVTVPSRTCFANGTAYTVSDASGGVALSQVADELPAATRLAVLSATARFLEGLHAQGMLYLDLKPANILVVTDALGQPTGQVKFFDFDTVARIGDPVLNVPSSGIWAAFEQTHPERAAEIGQATDVYALGVLAFWLLFGRTPSAAEVIHADGSWKVEAHHLAAPFAQAGAGEAVLAQIKALLDATLVVEPARRAQRADVPRTFIDTLAGLFTPADAALAEEFAKLNQVLAQAAEGEGKHRGRIVALILAALLLLASGVAVKMAFDAVSERHAQKTVDARDAMVLGRWVSTGAVKRDNLEVSPWQIQVTFEFYEDHTMFWYQDGKARRYSWVYGYETGDPLLDGSEIGGYTEFIILADTAEYGTVAFVLGDRQLTGARCHIVFAEEPLENYCTIYFQREDIAQKEENGRSGYRGAS